MVANIRFGFYGSSGRGRNVLRTATRAKSQSDMKIQDSLSSAETPERLRVLLSAFAISPFVGSEGGVGWETATRLAQYHDVTVLCGDLAAGRPTQAALTAYFDTHPGIPGLTIHYVESPPLARICETLHSRAGLWALYWVGYHLWQRRAIFEARRLHARDRFDVAHQLTFASYREPGYLWRLPVPFFWGSVGGATGVPLSFAPILGLSGTWRVALRNLGNFLQRRISFRARHAARVAQVVWAGGEDERWLIERWGGHAEYLPQSGTELTTEGPRTRSDTEPLRLLWSGRHDYNKALPLLLMALARLRECTSVTLDILGAGPDTSKCMEIAACLKLGPLINWHGHVPRTDALETMARAHVLVHTSLHEGTPGVVLEALSLGLPVICHGVSGMAVAVTDQCGIKVPLRDPDTSILGFASAIERLAVDRPLYARMSIGALARARELDWDSKIDRISGAYRTAVGGATTVSREEGEPARERQHGF